MRSSSLTPRSRAGLPLACAALLGTTVALTAAASERIVQPIDYDARAAVDRACAVPASSDCSLALEILARRVATELASATNRPGVDVHALARQAADSGFAYVRAAAATALASPYASAAETPVLAELADDPVPAVRAAALKSLRSSNDPTAQRIASRAEVYNDHAATDANDESSETAPAAASLGVPMPAGAVYLYFASNPGAGRYAWYTTQSPAQVLAGLAGKGKGPLTTAEFRAQADLSGGHDDDSNDDDENPQIPSEDQMKRAMAVAEQMMKAMDASKSNSPEDQAAAAQHAAQSMSSLDKDLATVYEHADLFGNPRLTIVQLAGGGEAVVAVYTDPVTGGTGITVHRAPLDGGPGR